MKTCAHAPWHHKVGDLSRTLIWFRLYRHVFKNVIQVYFKLFCRYGCRYYNTFDNFKFFTKITCFHQNYLPRVYRCYLTEKVEIPSFVVLITLFYTTDSCIDYFKMVMASPYAKPSPRYTSPANPQHRQSSTNFTNTSQIPFIIP